MPTADENAASRDDDWEQIVAPLKAGNPAVWCEWPEIGERDGPIVAGELEIRGWAMSPAGVEAVTVEVEGRGSFPARANLRRPDVRGAFFPAPWSRRPGFEVSIPTDGWAPGTYGVTISARDAADNSCSRRGRIRWHPSNDQLAADIAAGRPALWLGEPRFGADHPVGDFLSVRGWVRARAEIEEVVVELEGHGATTAFCGIPVPEADASLQVNAPPGSAFNAVLDTRALEPGSYALAVTATVRNGRSSRRSGQVVIDPGELYRRWLASHGYLDGAPGAVPGPAGARTRLRVCVTGAEEGEALRSSLSRQLHGAVAVEAASQGDLEAPLRSFLDDPGAAALVLVGGGDSLDPRALAQVATYLERDEPPDLIYADHDSLDAQHRRADPFLKPGWSPELLLSLDYIGSFAALGRAAAEAALRICPRPIDTVHALLLALVDEPLRVERIPLVLCTHGPGHRAPASPGEDAALREVGGRRGRHVRAGARDERTGVRELRWEVEGRPLVTVVIPTTGAEDPLSSCLRSLRERTSYEALEVVLVDSGGEAKSVAAGPLAGMEHRVVPFREQFNFSRACNLGAEEARGEFLLFLNDDTEALSPDWLERMLAYAQLPAVGVVGARLLFPEGLVQNGGLVLDRLPPPPGAFFLSALFSYLEAGSNGYHELLAVPRDCSAVTGACIMVPADLLRELGGWDEGFRMDFGDPDLCLRAREAGYRVVLEPRAVVLHRESATQGYTAHDEYDTRRFLGRWSRRYAEGDPWYHPACRFARDWELE